MNFTRGADLSRPSTSGKLHVDGTKIFDEKNRLIQLKGASTNNNLNNSVVYSSSFISKLSKEWNSNLLRVAIPAQVNYSASGSNLQIYYDMIDWATNNDMYVIIDWHSTQNDNPNNQGAVAAQFFSDVAFHYKGQNNIIFEIWNDSTESTSWNDIYYYADKVIPQVRNYCPESLIIVGTPMHNQSLKSVADFKIDNCSNVLYSYHFAAGSDGSYSMTDVQNAIDKYKLPLFVSEFCITDRSKDGSIYMSQADAWVDFMNNNKLSYAMWSFSDFPAESSIFKSGVINESNFNSSGLSDTGDWFRNTVSSK